jgi:RimJ/RimL family protein N-acetyltransferase
MHLKAGQTLSKHVLRDGTEARLRAPRMEDLDDVLEFINALVDEKAMIIVNKRCTRDDEAGYLANVLKEVETGKAVYVFAEASGKMMASSSISFNSGSESHTCTLGIAISKKYRGKGLGTILMKELIGQARRFGKKLIVLEAFETNPCARRLYEKVGFKEVGKIPKKLFYKGKYQAAIVMSKEL